MMKNVNIGEVSGFNLLGKGKRIRRASIKEKKVGFESCLKLAVRDAEKKVKNLKAGKMCKPDLRKNSGLKNRGKQFYKEDLYLLIVNFLNKISSPKEGEKRVFQDLSPTSRKKESLQPDRINVLKKKEKLILKTIFPSDKKVFLTGKVAGEKISFRLENKLLPQEEKVKATFKERETKVIHKLLSSPEKKENHELNKTFNLKKQEEKPSAILKVTPSDEGSSPKEKIFSAVGEKTRITFKDFGEKLSSRDEKPIKKVSFRLKRGKDKIFHRFSFISRRIKIPQPGEISSPKKTGENPATISKKTFSGGVFSPEGKFPVKKKLSEKVPFIRENRLSSMEEEIKVFAKESEEIIFQRLSSGSQEVETLQSKQKSDLRKDMSVTFSEETPSKKVSSKEKSLSAGKSPEKTSITFKDKPLPTEEKLKAFLKKEKEGETEANKPFNLKNQEKKPAAILKDKPLKKVFLLKKNVNQTEKPIKEKVSLRLEDKPSSSQEKVRVFLKEGESKIGNRAVVTSGKTEALPDSLTYNLNNIKEDSELIFEKASPEKILSFEEKIIPSEELSKSSDTTSLVLEDEHPLINKKVNNLVKEKVIFSRFSPSSNRWETFWLQEKSDLIEGEKLKTIFDRSSPEEIPLYKEKVLPEKSSDRTSSSVKDEFLLLDEKIKTFLQKQEKINFQRLSLTPGSKETVQFKGTSDLPEGKEKIRNEVLYAPEKTTRTNSKSDIRMNVSNLEKEIFLSSPHENSAFRETAENHSPLPAVRASELIDQILNQIELARVRNQNQARFLLRSEDFGNIHVNLKMERNTLVLQIQVSENRTGQLLQDNIHYLKQTLEREGIFLKEFSVGYEEDFSPSHQHKGAWKSFKSAGISIDTNFYSEREENEDEPINLYSRYINFLV